MTRQALRPISTRELQEAATAPLPGTSTQPGGRTATRRHQRGIRQSTKARLGEGCQRKPDRCTPSDAEDDTPRPKSGEPREPKPASAGSPPLVRVTAANSGAGASTVVLAIAEAAAATGATVRIIDAASPVWSGLAAASTVGLGTHAGWHRGRRGTRIWIDTLTEPATCVGDVPEPWPALPPAHTPTSQDTGKDPCPAPDLVVLDLGWHPRELVDSTCWLTTTSVDLDIVVVTLAPTSLRQTEHLLSHSDLFSCSQRWTVAVTNRARRRTEVGLRQALGPHLSRMRQEGRLVTFPEVSSRGRTDPAQQSLPKPLLLAAARVLTHLAQPAGAPINSQEATS